MENNNDVKRWKWGFSDETPNTDTAQTYDGWTTCYGADADGRSGSDGTTKTTYGWTTETTNDGATNASTDGTAGTAPDDGWWDAYGTRWTPDGRYGRWRWQHDVINGTTETADGWNASADETTYATANGWDE